MPDSPKKRLGLPKSQVVEVIERSQEEAVRRLLEAGVPERQILVAVRRIESACLTALGEQDAFYADLQVFFRQSRDPDHAHHIQERIAFYLKLHDSAVAEIVAIAIQDAVNEFQHPPAPPQPIITVTPPAPGLPYWLKHGLHTAFSLLLRATWITGFVAGLILSWVGGGSVFWSVFWSGVTVVVTALLWDWVGSSGWSLPIPLIAIGVFYLALLF
jgi:hypothetical protein